MSLALFFAILSLIFSSASVFIFVITLINMKRIRQTRIEIDGGRRNDR